METKHTPGPWHLNGPIVCANVQAGTVGIETPIADVCISGAERWLVEENANAKLIAAAPDLLEALKIAHRYMEVFMIRGEEPLVGECLKTDSYTVLKAIKKATP